MEAQNLNGLTKIQSGQEFSKLFEDQANQECFQCGKKTKQWAETKHAIFLCLTCAANYKQISKLVVIKSIGLDTWNVDEIKLLKKGGNKKFKQYLQNYNLTAESPKTIIISSAAEYYRRYLQAQANDEEIEDGPSWENGRKTFVADVPILEMTSDQILAQAKEKLKLAGQKTKYYGTKAYETISHKISSGEIKQDAKNAAITVGEMTKSIWGFISSKVSELNKPKLASREAEL